MKNIKPLTLLTLFFASFLTLAQSPKQISYQAVIRDANNDLLESKSVGVSISILENSIEGDALYVETHTVTTNENGLLTLSIGSGARVSGDFQGLDWASGSHFIKIEVDPNGGTSYNITHTSQLLSVPYALHANTADSVAGGVSQRLGLKLNDNELMITNDEASLPIDLSKYLGEIANLTAAERDSISSPKTGTIIFCTDCNEMQYYDSREWLNFYGQYGSGADTIRPTPRFEEDWQWMERIGNRIGRYPYLGEGQPLSLDTVQFFVTFNEKVDDFTAEDILYNNGEVIDFKLDKVQGSPRNQMYKVIVRGNQTEGKHYITIPENAATDIVGNLSKAASREYYEDGDYIDKPDSLTWYYDKTPPEVLTINLSDFDGNEISEGAITDKAYLRLTITFDERVEIISEMPKTNKGYLNWWDFNEVEAMFEIYEYEEGEVIIEIPDSSFMDLAGNINTESYRFSFKYGTEEDFQDGDGDGVYDADDLCLNTPAGAVVNALGCPDTDGDGVDDNEEFIMGNYKLLPRAGALAVGPAPDDLSWWSNSYDEAVGPRSCQFDDIYSFKGDGTFEINMGESTWLEQWQTNNEASGCGEPVAPFDGNGTYTWTADSSGTLTVSGEGAFLGLPQVHNNGELPNVAHPGAVTYEYSTSYDAEGYKILTLLIYYNNDYDAWWQFTLVDESYPVPVGPEGQADFSGVFNGTTYDSVTQVFNFPAEAEAWAGFANENVALYPLSFPNGGSITFNAAVQTSGDSVNVNFRFEKLPYPDVDPAFSTANVLVTTTVGEEGSYTVDIPAQDENNTYSSLLMYLVERDVPVEIHDIAVIKN